MATIVPHTRLGKTSDSNPGFARVASDATHVQITVDTLDGVWDHPGIQFGTIPHSRLRSPELGDFPDTWLGTGSSDE
jgi:hypothetical protein